MKSKKTIVLGASTNPSRYSYKAIERLRSKGHEVIAISLKKGEVAGVEFQEADQYFSQVDTFTLYLSPKNQEPYYDYILKHKPNRVIFNPGTYNEVLIEELNKAGIESLDACTLVMLSNGLY